MRGRSKRHRRRQTYARIALAALVIALVALLVLRASHRVPGFPIPTGSPKPTSDNATATSGWNANEAPDYYRVLGLARTTRIEEQGVVVYGELDRLGRATGAQATVTLAMIEQGVARERDDMSSLRPSGWGHNAIVDIPLPDGDVYHGYFWNRSHLLAKSLGGEEDVRNLITGTRMQNVGANDGKGGMAYCENLCRTWLAEHVDGWVSYVATPVYEGHELVARSVIVDLLSSDGTLDQRIVVYNAALGYDIDYATGSFERARE